MLGCGTMRTPGSDRPSEAPKIFLRGSRRSPRVLRVKILLTPDPIIPVPALSRPRSATQLHHVVRTQLAQHGGLRRLQLHRDMSNTETFARVDGDLPQQRIVPDRGPAGPDARSAPSRSCSSPRCAGRAPRPRRAAPQPGPTLAGSILLGTACSDSSSDSLKSHQVPTITIAAIARLTTGSSHSQPVRASDRPRPRPQRSPRRTPYAGRRRAR